MHVNNFFVCGPTFTVFFSSNVGGVLVDKLLFRLSICLSFSEIFAIKIESCQKSHQTLDGFFALQNFSWQDFQKLYPRYHRWLATRRLDTIPISPEVIDVHTLNFKPNFKFSRLNFLGETPVPVRVCAT